MAHGPWAAQTWQQWAWQSWVVTSDISCLCRWPRRAIVPAPQQLITTSKSLAAMAKEHGEVLARLHAMEGDAPGKEVALSRALAQLATLRQQLDEQVNPTLPRAECKQQHDMRSVSTLPPLTALADPTRIKDACCWHMDMPKGRLHLIFQQ